jgi:prepilin peptidase CpaA
MDGSADEFIFYMPTVLNIALMAVVLVAAAYDLWFRRIPNWLNLSGLVAGFGVNVLLFGVNGLRAASLGFVCALLIYLPLYLIRGMGAGDVKLMAAVGAIVGPGNWIGIFLATAIAGGVVSLFVIALKKRFHQTFWNLAVIGVQLLQFRVPSAAEERLDIRHSDALRLPHGAVIAAGCIIFLLYTARR